MTDKELKTLKENLWHAADMLRAGAHMAANQYGQPILGLIFLRYADILFKQHKDEIDAEFARLSGTRMEKTRKEIAIEKCGFFLPECAYYDFINDAPDTTEKATLVKQAMEAIEKENPKMEGVLPKEVYAQLVPEEEPELLSSIVRVFKDIPENCTIDIFGEIYEYFLGNFALAEGKDGGTFYTPATVVRYMVEVLNPQPGDKKFLEKTLSTLIQTNETYESTQIDAFFESKPKIDAFLKIDANAQRQEYKMASLHQRFWKQDAVFFHLTISLFSEQAIHHTQPSAAVSGNPCYRHCQPAAFLSRLHKEAPYQHPAS